MGLCRLKSSVRARIALPSAVSLVWFAIFGGSAISLQMGGTDIYGAGAPEAQLFSLLEQFPLSTLMSILVMVLVAIFFVSGADAASIVGRVSTQSPSALMTHYPEIVRTTTGDPDAWLLEVRASL